MNSHQAQIINQFTKQAIPFTELRGHYDAVQLLLFSTQVTSEDTVLDVACGPGMVTCAFAKQAFHATGIDITEKMLDVAQSRQKEEQLENISWVRGDVCQLPFSDKSFSLVITRYSFHHFLNPAVVLDEMLRVCRTGGRILIADVALPDDKAEAFNEMEKLCDPSHVKAMSHTEWNELFLQKGYQNCIVAQYKVEMELETQLKASFPEPGDDAKIRDLFYKDLERNGLGVNARMGKDDLLFEYPIAVFLLEV